MKRLYYIGFFLIFFFSKHISNAQGFIRAQAFQGTNLNKMLVDDSDHIYTVGSFQGTVDIDPGVGVNNLTAVGPSNMVIAKQDSAGNLLWAKQIKGRVWAPSGTTIYTSVFTNDKAGNLYVLGAFTDSFDLDPGPNNYWLGSTNGDYFWFILKLSPNGNFIWAKSYRSTTGASIGISGFMVRDTSIYVSGGITGTVDVDPGPDTVNAWPIIAPNAAILEKLDTAGHFHWVKQINGLGGLSGIIMDSSANIFTRGQYSNSLIDFDPGSGVATMTPTSTYDLFIEKFDSSGNYLWVKDIGPSYSDMNLSNWKVDNGNNLLILGDLYYGPFDFDPGPGVYPLTSPNAHKMFLWSFSNNGNFKWAKLYDCNYGGSDMTFDSSGNIYTIGYNGNPGNYPYSVFTQKIDSIGNHKWDISYNAQSIYPTSILLNHSYKLYTLGSFQGTHVDLDPTIGIDTFSSTGASFIQKLCTDSNPLTITVDSNYACATHPAHLTATFYLGATYSWYKNGVYFLGNSNLLTVTTSGTYTVEANGIGCTSFSDTAINIILGISDTAKIHISHTPFQPNVGDVITLNASIINGNSVPHIIIWNNNGVPFDTTTSNSTTYIKQFGTDVITADAKFMNLCSAWGHSNAENISAFTSITEIPKETSIAISPNPAKDQITVQYNQAGNLVFTDIIGRQLAVYALSSGKKEETMDVSLLAKGVYLLRFVSNEGAVETVKMMKE